jgi:acetylornithine deacetylase/succinyl-diaminopimelate desuccinylase-like protein
MPDDVEARLAAALREWVAIPSVSALGTAGGHMAASAEYLVRRALDCGMTRAEVWSSAGLPSVFAERIEDPSLPTVLVYTHHDVQPADPLSEWDGDPFTAVDRDGWICGRGASDDKSQILIHLEAVRRALRSHGRLPVNVRLIADGEEEVGSPTFGKIVVDHRKDLAADILVVSDTSMPSADVPGLTVACRGLVYWELSVRTAASDLHSGAFGGAIQSASVVMSHILARLRDLDGNITVPGFYEDVVELDESERRHIASREGDDGRLISSLGAAPAGEAGFNTAERRMLRPTLDVCGVWSGYTGLGPKTVIPATAHAKLSSRVVPNQRPERLTEALRAHISTIAPRGSAFELTQTQAASWLRVDYNVEPFQIARALLEELWGHQAELLFQGGSIPPVATLRDLLQVPVVIVGFGLPENRNHAPNERVSLAQLGRGVETIERLWTAYGQLSA